MKVLIQYVIQYRLLILADVEDNAGGKEIFFFERVRLKKAAMP